MRYEKKLNHPDRDTSRKQVHGSEPNDDDSTLYDSEDRPSAYGHTDAGPAYADKDVYAYHEPNDQEHSDQVQTILGTPPGWLVRYGISLFFLIVLILAIGSWLVKYPETIPVSVTLTSATPPMDVVAQSTGKISELFVKENQFVSGGKVLAIVENTAQYADILRLQKLIKKPVAQLYNSRLPLELNLGEIQAAYADLVKSCSDYTFFVRTHYHNQSKALLKNRIRSYDQLKRNSRFQVSLLERALLLSQKKYSTDSSLLKGNIIAPFDLAASESAFLEKKNSYLQSRASHLTYDVQINQLQKELLDLEVEQQAQNSQLRTSLEQNLAKVKTALAAWEQKYVIKSPVNGYISFHRFWSRHQNVKTGDIVMTIVPLQKELFCQAKLPTTGAGKVKLGQRMNIRFDNYPSQEYGYVIGIVDRISLVPRENSYIVTARLPYGLKTNYGIRLDYKQEIQGNGEIVTEDLRLIERLFFRLKAIWMQ